MEIPQNDKNNFFFGLKTRLKEHLNGENKQSAFNDILETNTTSSLDNTDKLKIALHLDSYSNSSGDLRTVTLRSLTNPSVAVRFNAISPEKSTFSLDDKLFTALDFIFRLVPQDFNSIDTHTQLQDGDINISLGDKEEIMTYQYTKNESDKLVSNPCGIMGLSISKAPEEVNPDSNTGFISRKNQESDEDYLSRCANALSLPNELNGPNGLVTDTEYQFNLFNDFITSHSGKDHEYKAEKTLARYLVRKSNRFKNPNLEMIGDHPRPYRISDGCSWTTEEGRKNMMAMFGEFDEDRICLMFNEGLQGKYSAKHVFDYFPHRCTSWTNLPGEGKYDDFLKNPVPYMWGFTKVFVQLQSQYKYNFIKALNFLAQDETNQG